MKTSYIYKESKIPRKEWIVFLYPSRDNKKTYVYACNELDNEIFFEIQTSDERSLDYQLSWRIKTYRKAKKDLALYELQYEQAERFLCDAKNEYNKKIDRIKTLQ